MADIIYGSPLVRPRRPSGQWEADDDPAGRTVCSWQSQRRTRTDADGGATATTFSPPSIIRPPLLPSLLPPFLPNIDSSPFAIIVSSSSSSSPPSRGWENSLRYSAPHCAPYPDPLDFPTAMRSSYVVLSQPLRLQCASEKGRDAETQLLLLRC